MKISVKDARAVLMALGQQLDTNPTLNQTKGARVVTNAVSEAIVGALVQIDRHDSLALLNLQDVIRVVGIGAAQLAASSAIEDVIDRASSPRNKEYPL